MPDPVTTLKSRVSKRWERQPLIEYLCGRFAYQSRESWHAEIKAGRLSVNGKPAQSGTAVQLDDEVAYTAPRHEPEVNRDIVTLWEDEHLLVVNKPAPLPVHADGAFLLNTLSNILREKTQNPQLQLGHRLDRETSGVLVLSKTKAATAPLMAAFERSDVGKTYTAVVRGVPSWKEELVRGGMGPDPASQISIRQKLFASGTPGTKESTTRLLLKEKLKDSAVLECLPLTGRTNQIRVHLEAAGFPLAGDKLYGREDQVFLDYTKFVKAGGDQGFGGRLECPRHLLHASELRLRHPITGTMHTWSAPLPQDMLDFISAQRA